jgi:hypothetical protein
LATAATQLTSAVLISSSNSQRELSQAWQCMWNNSSRLYSPPPVWTKQKRIDV